MTRLTSELSNHLYLQYYHARVADVQMQFTGGILQQVANIHEELMRRSNK